MAKSMFATDEPLIRPVNWKTRRPQVEIQYAPWEIRERDHAAGDNLLNSKVLATPFSRSGVRSSSNLRVALGDDEELPPWVTASPRQSTPKTLAPLAESVHEDGSRPTRRPSSSQSGRTASPSGRDIGTASSSGQSHGSVQPSPQLSEHIKKLGEEDDDELISALSEHEMWRSVTGMIKLVQGDSEQAAANRAAVGAFPVVFENLGKLLAKATMTQTEQMLYVLSQLAFLNEANSHIILSTHGVVPKLVDAAFGDDEAGRLDAARLLNNLSGSSESAALAIGNRPGIMDAVRHLCCSGTFAVRLRALGILVSLSRQHQLHHILKESEIFEMAAAAAAHDKAATQEYALFCVAMSTVEGALMTSFKRKHWAADRHVLATTCHILRCATRSAKFGGATPTHQTVLDALKIFVVGEASRKALFELGVVDGLIELVETWQEDSRKPLNPQLAILEAALQLITTMSGVAGCKRLLKGLRASDLLVTIVDSKPSSNSVSMSRSLLHALGVAKGTISSPPPSRSGVRTGMPASPPREGRVPFGNTHWSAQDVKGGGGKGGKKKALTRSQQLMALHKRGGSFKDAVILAPVSSAYKGQANNLLAWSQPARESAMTFIRCRAGDAWAGVLEQLNALARGGHGGGHRGGVPDVFQLMGRHGIWMSPSDCEEFSILFSTKGEDGVGVDAADVADSLSMALSDTDTATVYNERVDFLRRMLVSCLANWRSTAHEALTAADADRSGHVELADFREVLKELGWKVKDSQIGRLRQTFDERGDGHVKYAAFLQVFDEAIRFSPETAVQTIMGIRNYQASRRTDELNHSASLLEHSGRKFRNTKNLRKAPLPSDAPPPKPAPAATSKDVQKRTESVNSFATVQSYVPEPLARTVSSRDAPRLKLLGGAGGGREGRSFAPPPSSYQDTITRTAEDIFRETRGAGGAY